MQALCLDLVRIFWTETLMGRMKGTEWDAMGDISIYTYIPHSVDSVFDLIFVFFWSFLANSFSHHVIDYMIGALNQGPPTKHARKEIAPINREEKLS